MRVQLTKTYSGKSIVEIACEGKVAKNVEYLVGFPTPVDYY